MATEVRSLTSGSAGAVSIDALKDEIDRALSEVLPPADAWPARLHEAMRYSALSAGKRLRPTLAVAACDAVGGSHRDALPFACAVELIHTYSLVHDDLPAMDDDDLRRGQPAAHTVYGEALAILSGDALLTRAFELIVSPPDPWSETRARRQLGAAAQLAAACGSSGLIGGQVEDLAAEGQALGVDALEHIHRAKTAALLRASAVGGAILGGANEGQLAGIGAYGRAIGLAFQIVDDILDATESSQRLGKTAGKDRVADKATYVRVLGVDAARARAAALLDEACAALVPMGPGTALLAELARRIVERSR